MMGNSVVGVLLYCVEPLLFYYYKSVCGAHTGPWRSFRGSEASRGTYILPAAKFEEGIQILLLPPAGTQIISRESKIDITC